MRETGKSFRVLMQELVDGVDEDFTLNDFYAYRQRHGLV